MDGGAQRVDTVGAEIELEPDLTMVIRIKPVHMTGEVMATVLEGRFALARKRVPVLVDTRAVLSMTREAQEMSAAPEIVPFTECLALLVKSGVTVVLANFFMVFVRPKYPTKMFRDEQRARAWLAQVRSPRP